MAKIESYRDLANLATQVTATVYDRDLSFDPKHFVAEVRYKMICAIVERIMEQIGPKIDAAINEAFSVSSEDRQS